ncbi:conserved membrane hypothetical protein [Pseudomonas sp. 8BK]|uniref:hypothetical protein n=1 Tax=Pseudomonas sp. 8BK TaxID=2653164 RepID=UPI0012F46731|nr:hypothetical protein [Pseudomonas sp. 8BK]VXB82866.1 conserved membrane hypothetical protein [Pseudomonas sp. 8BK]
MTVKGAEYDCPGHDRQLLKVVLALLFFIVPLMVGATQPPLLSAGLIGLLAFGMGMAAVHGRSDLAKHFRLPLVFSFLGLSFYLWTAVSGFLGFCVGLFILVFSVIALTLWTSYLGLDKHFKAPTVTAGRQALLRFQGHPVEWPVVAAQEYLPASGLAWTELLGRRFSLTKDLRHSLKPAASKASWSRLAAQVIGPSTAAIDEISAPLVEEHTGLCSGEVDGNGTLWFVAPQAGHRLRGEPLWPDGVNQAEPAPCFGLWLDDQPSGLLLDAGEAVLWREDGESLVCRARPESQSHMETGSSSWLWQASVGWRLLSEPWQQLVGDPMLEWRGPSRLDACHLWYEGLLQPLSTESLEGGYELRVRPDCRAVLLGHDAGGRALLGQRHLAPVRLCTPLDAKGREGLSLELAPMQGGVRPCLSWMRTSLDARQSVFSCRIGTWQLEGQWCLDHRVSDCGRYLALIAFAEFPAVPHRLFVADILAQRLLMLEEAPLIACLDSFQSGVVSFICIRGRLADAVESTPLQRFQQAAPDPQQGDRFVAATAAGRLYYERLQLTVDPLGLRLLPTWRLALQPPVASAQGDCILPAPGGRDAAWMFASAGISADKRASCTEPCGGACLITASGCAVPDLAPSMIWSADGRYLVLSRLSHCEAGQAGVTEAPHWNLLLLDTQDRALYTAPQAIGCRPCFEGFDAQVLLVRTFANDQETAGDLGELMSLPLASLLAWPKQMLIRSVTLWMPSEELPRGKQWERLDTGHLRSWRTVGDTPVGMAKSVREAAV